jgi:hypothetical protein
MKLVEPPHLPSLTYLTEEDANKVKAIFKRAYVTCGPCYGTGWENYKDFRNAPGFKPLAPKVDCKRCDGLGAYRSD